MARGFHFLKRGKSCTRHITKKQEWPHLQIVLVEVNPALSTSGLDTSSENSPIAQDSFKSSPTNKCSISFSR
jgi:hypothetical protein